MKETNKRLETLIENKIDNCCEKNKQKRLSELQNLKQKIPENYTQHIKAMKALSSETKYKITKLLTEAKRELCVCEITPLFEVSESAISHALSDLRNAKLVKKRKEGKWHYYKPTDRARRIIETFDKNRNE